MPRSWMRSSLVALVSVAAPLVPALLAAEPPASPSGGEAFEIHGECAALSPVPTAHGGVPAQGPKPPSRLKLPTPAGYIDDGLPYNGHSETQFSDLPQSPAPKGEWSAAIAKHGGPPPDAQIAVGKHHVVVGDRQRLAIFTKNGNPVQEFSMWSGDTGDFFEPLGLDGNLICVPRAWNDVRTIYDEYRDRFWVVASSGCSVPAAGQPIRGIWGLPSRRVVIRPRGGITSGGMWRRTGTSPAQCTSRETRATIR